MTLPVNPFVNRAMIRDASEFVGRAREIEQIVGRVLSGSKVQSCSVVGQRRIGKSSFFRRLLSILPERDPRTVVAYVDLETARKLAAGKFFATLHRRLAATLGREAARGDEAEAFDELSEFLERSERDHRFVLLLDEFDTVTSNPAFDADFFGALRSLANNYDLAFITSSYQDLTDLCHAEEVRQSPFFNVFTTLDLGLMLPAEVATLLERAASCSSIPLTPAVRAMVADLGGRYPFFLNVAGSAAWELLAAGDPVTDASVRSRFRDEARPHFRYFVDHLPSAERAALYQFSQGELPEPELLRRLRRRALIEEAGGGDGAFVPFVPEFAVYVSERAQEGLQGTTIDGAGRRLEDGPTAGASAALRRSPRESARGLVIGARVADRYHLTSLLGEGGFGSVFQARDELLERNVAVKFLRFDLRRMGREMVLRRERFSREAVALARMRHPNVVTVYDLGEWSGVPFIVMEYAEGGALKARIERLARLGFREVVRTGIEAAGGLGHAHALGIIHRDVKPANLMLELDGRVRVGDFGVMRDLEEETDAMSLTGEGRTVGTPAYMAPEQLSSAAADARADLYSLGVVLYECATGRRPFGGDTLSQVARLVIGAQPPDPRIWAPDLPEAFVRLLERAMAKDPEARFASAAEFAAGLTAVAPPSG